MAKAKILVVDDDTAMRELMRLSLSKEGFEVRAAASSTDALNAVSEETFDVVVTDIYLGDGTGLDLLEHCRTHLPEANVILVTAHGTIETAASARRLGVFDYLAKPFAVDALVARVRAALQSAGSTQNRVELGPDSMIIGNDPAIVEVYNTVARVAPLPIPVLIRGETGTGKELIARALHLFGAKPDGPFVPINCGAIPENLLESELFGHRKGSFTGADRDHPGAVESSRNGTLFLDEIGELPASLQVKLLRFLQSGEVRPVGSDRPLQVPVRVVAATNRDLRAEVEAGSFREDFYFRLAAYEIELPPLRDRRSDIPALVEHFRRRHAENLGLDTETSASKEVLAVFDDHSWPGNVRELEHVVQRALVDSGSLTDAHRIQQMLVHASDGPAATAAVPGHRRRPHPQGAREAPHRGRAPAMRRQPHPRRRNPRHRTQVAVPQSRTTRHRARPRGGRAMKRMTIVVAVALAALGAAPNPDPQDALVYQVVAVKRHLLLATATGELELQAGDHAQSGDSLRTGSRSSADLEVADRAARFHIGTKTSFRLTHDKPGVLIDIQRGSLRAVFGKLPEGDDRERLVTTPSAVLAVRGTEYGLEVAKDGDTTLVVFEGTVEVRDLLGRAEPVLVGAGLSTRIRTGRGPSAPSAHGISTTDWDRGQRSERPNWSGGQQTPAMGNQPRQGGAGSQSQASQGGSKQHGG